MKTQSYIDKREMTRDEWLLARKNSIGASEVAAVMGISKYQTPYDIYQDKISPDLKSLPDSWRLFIGREAEEPIARYYVQQTGRQVKKDNKIRLAEKYPFISANLDRVITPSGNETDEDKVGPGILECKITDTIARKSWDAEYPLEYFCQVQHQLFVMGWNWAELAIGVGVFRSFFRSRFYRTKNSRKKWSPSVLSSGLALNAGNRPR